MIDDMVIDIVAGESLTSFFISFSLACKLHFLTILILLQAQIDSFFASSRCSGGERKGFDKTIVTSKPS